MSFSASYLNRLRAELKNYKPINFFFIDKVSAEIKTLKPIDKAQLRNLQSQINQQALNFPEIKRFQSPEFQKQLQDQIQAAQQQVGAAQR